MAVQRTAGTAKETDTSTGHARFSVVIIHVGAGGSSIYELTNVFSNIHVLHFETVHDRSVCS